MGITERRQQLADRLRLPEPATATSAPVVPPPAKARHLSAVVIGTVGGIGTSTLAETIGPWASTYMPGLGEHDMWPPLVIVTTATTYGAQRGTKAVNDYASNGRPVILAVVSDGHGPMPVGARTRLKALEPQVVAIEPVPYVDRWRYDPPRPGVPADPPARYRRAASRITKHIEAIHHQKEQRP